MELHSVHSWAGLEDITVNDIEKYGLVKGVAMSEGLTVRNEEITRDDIINASASLRASAFHNKSNIKVNHGNETFGRILDANAVNNDGKEQIEFIGSILDKEIYEKVKAGKYGVSIEHEARKKICESGSCKFEGITTVDVSLVDQLPNSYHTKVEPLTEADLPKIIKHSALEEPEPDETESKDKDSTLDKESESQTETKTDDKTEVDLSEFIKAQADRFEKLEAKWNSIYEKQVKEIHMSQYNDKQIAINNLKQQLKEKSHAMTPNDHADYLAIKDRIAELKKKE